MREKHIGYARWPPIANSSPAALSHAEFVKPVVIDSKIMSKFMKHGLANLLADLVVIGADGFDVLLVDADLVRSHQVVVLAAVSQRDAVVEAKEQGTGPKAGPLAVESGWTPFDDDVHIVDPAEKPGRQRGNGFADQAAKFTAFQD